MPLNTSYHRHFKELKWNYAPLYTHIIRVLFIYFFSTKLYFNISNTMVTLFLNARDFRMPCRAALKETIVSLDISRNTIYLCC